MLKQAQEITTVEPGETAKVQDVLQHANDVANVVLKVRSADPFCECCSLAAPASVFCEQCGGWRCDQCNLQTHPSTNMLLSKHARIPVAVYNSSSPESNKLSDSLRQSKRSSVNCAEHPEEPATCFCLRCEVAPFCVDCIPLHRHPKHPDCICSLRRAYPSIHTASKALIEELQLNMSQIINGLEMRKTHSVDVSAAGAAIQEEMHESFRKLHEALEEKEAQLKENIVTFMAERKDANDGIISHLQDQHTQSQAIVALLATDLEVGVHDPGRLLSSYVAAKSTARTLLHDKEGKILLQKATRPMKCYLNMEAAEKQIADLKGLHLVIANMEAKVGM